MELNEIQQKGTWSNTANDLNYNFNQIGAEIDAINVVQGGSAHDILSAHERIDDVEAEIKRLHYPFGINTLTATPSLIEIGTSSQAVVITWSYNNSDRYTVSSQKLNGTTIAVGTLTSTQNVDKTTHKTTTFTLNSTTSTGESASKSVSVTVNHVSYYGVVEAGKTSLIATEVKSLTKSLRSGRSLSAKFTQDNQKVTYAYPSYFGNLTSVKNSSGFEGLSGYTKTSVTVDGQEYYVYIQNDAATSSDTLTFS